MEKYITFWVPIKKELENGQTVIYEIKFTNRFRFMSSSLWSLADNLAEGFHNNKSRDSKSCLKYVKTEDTHIIFQCLKCHKNHKNILIKT